ncbi:MAG: hypothetical protein P1U69_16485 [Parvibaculaceae bacterium]|nr:hypothetical protein [Parvibaculaceae bacterium]
MNLGPRNRGYLIGFFMAWPLLGAIFSFLTLHRRISQVLLSVFFTILGYRFVIEDERFDSFRYARYFEEMALRSSSEFFDWFSAHCFHSEACLDPALPVLSFFLSRFSDDPSIAFAGFAAIFGALAVTSLAMVRRDINRTTLTFGTIILFCIFALNPIQNINGFRFNAAIWAYFAGAYLVFFRQRDLGLILVFSTIVFHYAFTPIIALTLALRLGRPSLRVALILGLSSFLVSTPIGYIVDALDIENTIGAITRAGRYVNEDYLLLIQERQKAALSSNLFFSVFAPYVLKGFMALCFVYMLILRTKLRYSVEAERLMVASILLFAATNVLASIPSVDRFTTLAAMLFVSSFAVSGTTYKLGEQRLLLALLLPVLLFFNLASIRLGLAVLDLAAFAPSLFLFAPRTSIL